MNLHSPVLDLCGDLVWALDNPPACLISRASGLGYLLDYMQATTDAAGSSARGQSPCVLLPSRDQLVRVRSWAVAEDVPDVARTATGLWRSYEAAAGS